MLLPKLKNYWIFLLLVFVLAGCSTTAKEKKFEKDGLTLMYHPKATVGFEGDDLKLQHPVNISEAMVRNHLTSLYFEGMYLMGKEKPVFLGEDIEKISPWLTKALNRVTPNDVVYFEIQTTNGVTITEVFSSSNKLHWRFPTIRGIDFSKRTLGGWGNANTWRLAPKGGQSYYLANKVLGKRTVENWVSAALDLPETARNAKMNQTRSTGSQKPKKPAPNTDLENPKKSSGNRAELEEKLRFLKQLQEKGLIDEDEYKRKRKTLVDENL